MNDALLHGSVSISDKCFELFQSDVNELINQMSSYTIFKLNEGYKAITSNDDLIVMLMFSVYYHYEFNKFMCNQSLYSYKRQVFV